jgi:hypothetical protein
MRKRWGLGPVFVYESILNARRWQVYAARSFFVLVLLLGMVVVWIGKDQIVSPLRGRSTTFRQMAAIGQGFFYALTGIQVSLVLLAAPAAAAGSIGIDRARGTLVHMLVTDLSDTEIVLGKLAARLAPTFGLIATGVPVTALAGLLGGIDFGALAGSFVVSLVLAVLGCALALTISVWVAKLHEVLMAVYVAEGLWLLALPVWEGISVSMKIMGPPAWFQKLNPFLLVFAPYSQPGFASAADYAVFTGVALLLAAALVGLSIARLRRVVVGQSGREEKASWRGLRLGKRVFPSWPSPTLDGHPVLWREWHRNRPSKLARRLWAGLLLVAWGLAAWGTYGIITEGVSTGSSPFVAGFMFQLLFGFLMLSATAPTALAEEQVRGSLDVLLATPLATSAIVWAKWWGAYRRVLVLALLPLYAGVFLAATAPDTPLYAIGAKWAQSLVPLTNCDRVLSFACCMADFLASGALIVSLGLLLATWGRRLGRAVALSVIAFFLTGIGWLFVVELLAFRLRWMINPQRWIMICVTSLSPAAGPMNAIDVVIQVWFEPRKPLWIGLGVVILIKWLVAGMLLGLTIWTFDRCMGRVSEMRAPRRSQGAAFTVRRRPSARDRARARPE